MKKSAIALLLFMWPQHVAAMTIENFDSMVAEDQRHYVMFLVVEATKLLTVQAQPELARSIDRLFREIPPGERRSTGELQFQKSLAEAREAKVRLTYAPRAEVEFAFCDALFNLGITTAPEFNATFGEVIRNRAFFPRR